jgi:hypothetical protein
MAGWRLHVQTLLPRGIIAIEPPTPGSDVPQKIGLADRLASSVTQRLDDVDVTIDPTRNDSLLLSDSNQTLDIEALVADAPDAIAAGLKAMPLVDFVLDDLSFQVQRPLPRGQVEIFQVVAEGDADFLVTPGGLDVASRETSRAEYPSVRGGPPLSLTTRRALRYYIAGLAVPKGEEAFILYWTSLEHLFAHEGTEVVEPATIHGHYTIKMCPRCKKSTAQPRHGQSLKRYLTQLGVTPQQADDLYGLRMMVHGRTPDERLLAETERLRMLVGKRLASLLGLPDSVVQPMMIGFMYALGTTPGR